MRFVLDHGMPADSIDRYYTEMVHDGKPETPPFHVQLHWHKVGNFGEEEKCL
jgi:hypothetical protein